MFTILGPLVVAGCGSRYGAPRSASRQGDDILGLWRGLFWAAAVIGALVVGLILWAVFRYRHRGPVDELPAQTHSNIPLELFYTAVAQSTVGRARVWRLYMAACALNFEDGNTQVHQLLGVKPDGGRSGMPLRPRFEA